MQTIMRDPQEPSHWAGGYNAFTIGHGERTPDPSWGNQGRLPGGGDSQVIPESGVAWVKISGGQGIQGKWLTHKKGVSHP